MQGGAGGRDRYGDRLDGRLLNLAEGAVMLFLRIAEGVLVTEADETGGESQDRDQREAQTERGALSQVLRGIEIRRGLQHS